MTTKINLTDNFYKKIDIEFSAENTSSDTGLLLFKSISSQLNVLPKIAQSLNDPRNPSQVVHSYQELIGQRLSQLIAGYNDLNDSDFLRKDEIFKLFAKNENFSSDLASTSTMFRIENNVNIRESKKLVEEQAKMYLKRNEKRFKKEMKKKGYITITLNLDPTDVETYGSQQLSLFNGYYGSTCYLPMIIGDGDNNDLICGYLRPGTKHACWCLESVLTRLFDLIEKKYRKVKFRLRADSGFQKDSFFKFLEKNNVIYTIALAKNSILIKMTDDYYKDAHILLDDEKSILKIYKEDNYQAGSWEKERRVCCKLEINHHGHDTRFVVTNDNKPREKIFSDYNQRANIENVIKEIKLYSGGDQLSAEKFSSNFFRFCMACFTFIIFQEFKKKISTTKFKNSYVSVIREKFIKVAGIIKVSTRRILVQISRNYPFQKYWPLLI